MKNYYEILEVSPQATTEQIKMAVVQLGKKYAAKAQNNEAARNKFNEIQQAYKILSHPQRRKYHDEDLAKVEAQKRRVAELRQSVTQYLTVDGQKLKQHLSVWASRILRKPQFPSFTMHSTKKHDAAVQTELETPDPIEDEETRLLLQSENHFLSPLKRRWLHAKQTKYGLMRDETLLFYGKPHVFSCIDFGALILIVFAIYLFPRMPSVLNGYMPVMTIWVPSQIINTASIEVSLWDLAVSTMLLMGIAIQIEVVVHQFSTELLLTQRRIITKTGLLSQRITEIKLSAMESISIKQSILGYVLGYGSITITGMGYGQTTLRHISAPHKMKQLAWLYIKEVQK